MTTIMIIIIEKDLTSSCNEKTRLIFENVTKQSRFKNQLEVLTLSLSYYNHYMRSLLLFEIYFINSIY